MWVCMEQHATKGWVLAEILTWPASTISSLLLQNIYDEVVTPGNEFTGAPFANACSMGNKRRITMEITSVLDYTCVDEIKINILIKKDL